MAGFDIITVLAHVVLVTTLATMVYSVLVYFVSRHRSRKPSTKKPAPVVHGTHAVLVAASTPTPVAHGARTDPVVKIYPLP
jgi:heme/copper-type cytochrome/quinol oxidase subunit 2